MWTVLAAYVLLGIAGWLVLPYTAGIIENYMYDDEVSTRRTIIPGSGGQRGASGGGNIDKLAGDGNDGGRPDGKSGGSGGGAGGSGLTVVNNASTGAAQNFPNMNAGVISFSSAAGGSGGSQHSSQAGLGIDGYGIGGSGGVQMQTSYQNAFGPLTVAFTYNTNGSATNGTAGATNSGNGGGGGSALGSASSVTANGAAGGSGYCRVTYWT
jgi:hypothetical protein